MSVAAAIIAGGQATRMGGAGGAKGLLIVEGRRIIDRQLEVLRPLFTEVLLVANDASPWHGLGVRVVPDRVAGGLGPLAGVDAALAALPEGAQAVVCVAGDMPFLGAGVLGLLRDTAPGAMAVVPQIGVGVGGVSGGGGPQPLLARYARAAAPIIRAQLDSGNYAMMSLLDRLSVTWLDEAALRAVDPLLRCLVNVNTPADLIAAGGTGAPAGLVRG